MQQTSTGTATAGGPATEQLWTATAVPLSAIESELEKLWRRPSPAEVAEGVPAVARARVMNFVAYANSEALAEQVSTMIEHLVNRHPSRTIVVVADEGNDTPGLDATVAVRAQQADDQARKIMYEQVRIHARGAVGESLPSIVVPLLVPDLPTYLWWPGNPPVGNEFWRRMVDACDRLILNSGEFSRPLETMTQFATFYRGARRLHTFGDLNWNRLTQWRELIAQFFDNQNYRPFLDSIQEITIVFSGALDTRIGGDGRSNPSRALLMAAWLCSRLGWESNGCQSLPHGLRFHLIGWPSGRALTLQLEEHAGSMRAPATVEAIRLTALHDGHWATFTVAREEGSDLAHTTVELAGLPDASRAVRMVSQQLHMLLGQELESSGQDEVYESALAVAGIMAGQARKVRP